MTDLTTSELEALEIELSTQLLNSNNTGEQFIKIRSQWYKVESELYFRRKRMKLIKPGNIDFYILPAAASYQF